MPFIPEITNDDVQAVGQFTNDNLDIFIDHADTYMGAVFEDDALPAPLFRLVGVYLAAHFAYLQQGQIKSDKVDVLSTTFNMTTGLALNSTTHGQQALALDASGTLSRLNSQASQKQSSRPYNSKGAIDFI